MGRTLFDSLIIGSPKRKKGLLSKQAEFFPYYAGFPENFATAIIETSGLPANGIVFDPWNGSGTTTTAAAQLGYDAYGTDLNPVMVIVALARNLSDVEAKNLLGQADFFVEELTHDSNIDFSEDPLLQWFTIESTELIRNLEYKIRKKFLPNAIKGIVSYGQEMPREAAALYVALFITCRLFTKPFKSTNPTWLRLPKEAEPKIKTDVKELTDEFLRHVRNIASSVQIAQGLSRTPYIDVSVSDTTNSLRRNFADLVLTSPPYCTRIDYTAATRIELALIEPLLVTSRETLSRSMIGSIKVPLSVIEPKSEWGKSCLEFLEKLTAHGSKASKGYYFKTHLDYFDKLFRSLANISGSLKDDGQAIFVVQDSYYKEIHNNLPCILSEMAAGIGLCLYRRENFVQNNSISQINSGSSKYRRAGQTVESVICFKKEKEQLK